MASLEDVTRHPAVRQLLTLAERQCVYACCGLDAFDGDESSWDENSRAAYAALLEAADAATVVVAIDEVLRVLERDGYLDSNQLNGSIVVDSTQGREVIEYLRRARDGYAGRRAF